MDETSAAATAADERETSAARWTLLGLGGTASLCCLVAAPAATGAAGATVAGGATAAIGGGLVRVFVSALTVGLVALVLRFRAGSCDCEA
jgi:hypothetical protein